MKLDFDDLLIVPADITDINSRSEINIEDESGRLPIFTAPMDTVVKRDKFIEFTYNHIRVILPREKLDDVGHQYSTSDDCWYSYGLSDFNKYFVDVVVSKNIGTVYALLDVANGHMPAVRDAIIKAKANFGKNLVVMAGNVANPETYRILSNAGADYVRVGIGNGGGCLTTQQTGVGYPMASLVRECYKISCELKNPAKIVADGGMKKYSDIIKALALGADYVMLGSIFNKALESASEVLIKPHEHESPMTISEYLAYPSNPLFEVNRNIDLISLMNSGMLYKQYRGMSTKEVQKSWGNEKLKTSEGIVKYQQVEYTVSGWCENFEHYLRSAMSYTNSKTLKEFIGNVSTIQISNNALNRFNK